MSGMSEVNRVALMRLVSEWLNVYGDERVADAIGCAHRARPDGDMVTTDNLHLVRQYRNTRSSVPADLINDALTWRGRG